MKGLFIKSTSAPEGGIAVVQLGEDGPHLPFRFRGKTRTEAALNAIGAILSSGPNLGPTTIVVDDPGAHAAMNRADSGSGFADRVKECLFRRTNVTLAFGVDRGEFRARRA